MTRMQNFLHYVLPWHTRDVVPASETVKFFDVWRAEADFLKPHFDAFGTQDVDSSDVSERTSAIDPFTLSQFKRGRDAGQAYKTVGLALSGGGIRAASFSLGVLQGLNLERKSTDVPYPKTVRWLDEIDYLSTVSGGGYAGAAFTYYRKLYHDSLDPENDIHEALKGVQLRHFPEPEQEVLMRRESRMLDFTRFRRDHLTPTRSLNLLSMAAITLRTILISWPIYLAALTLLLGVYYAVAWLFMGQLFDDLTAGLFGCTPAASGLDGVCQPTDKTKPLIQDGLKWLLSPSSDTVSSGRWLLDLDRPQLAFALLLGVGSVALFSAISIVGLVMAGLALYTGGTHYKLRRFSQKALGWIVLVLLSSVILFGVPLFADYFFDANNPARRAYLISLVFGGNIIGGVSLVSLTEGAVVKRIVSTKLLIILAALIIIIGNLILAYEIAEFLIIQFNAFYLPGLFVSASEQQSQHLLLGLGGAVALFIFGGWITNLNYVSLHRMYRDRLMEAFMPDVSAFVGKQNARAAYRADRLLLRECAHRPLHIVNTNVVLTNSPQSRYRGRFGDSFVLSPLYSGSWATGYRKTCEFSARRRTARAGQAGFYDPGMTLATATAISGAAINPRVGPSGWDSALANPIVASMVSFFNLRLGCWVANPSAMQQDTQAHFFNAGLQGLLNAGFTEKNTKLVELTDGGHFENTGLFELLRRRMDVIILADATADKAFNFKDIGIAIERARVDQSVDIRFCDGDLDLTHLMPGSAGESHYDKRYGLSSRGFALAEIRYPAFVEPARGAAEATSYPAKTGYLIYLKPVMTRKLPADIYSYKGAFEAFPYQPISDQMFDESQFEAYRELGFQITATMAETLYPRIADYLSSNHSPA